MSSSSHTTTMIRLHPWRDGIDYCLQQLKDAYDQEENDYENKEDGYEYEKTATITRRKKAARPAVVVSSIRNGQFTFHKDDDSAVVVASNNHHTQTKRRRRRRKIIQTVDICFEMSDILRASRRQCDNDTTQVQEQKWTMLLDTIAFLPDLTSFLLRVVLNTTPGNNNVMEDDNDRMIQSDPWLLPSLTSITNLLANATSLEYFTLMGIPLATSSSTNNNNDLDMNGFLETLRIHPSLVSVAIQKCTFGSITQMTRLEEILRERQYRNNIGGKEEEAEIMEVDVVDTNQLATSVPVLSWWQQCCFFFW